MKLDNPYRNQPSAAFWRRSIADVAMSEVDPLSNMTLKVDRDTKVATGGSCFAQHIARRLQQSGFTYLVTESAPDLLDEDIAKEFNYGTFSARFGNIYTSRQLIQLVDRAYGDFTPSDTVWHRDDGRLIDPYRPVIQPDGFSSAEEFERDRSQHLEAVRTMLEDCDLFVFTMGLTECWINETDGAAYPLCPGTVAGQFDPSVHKMVNLSVGDVMNDMEAFVERFAAINPTGKILLTVSPVALVATATDEHVLTATVYSKSVLRVAAGELTRKYENVHYLPSYEIITGSFNRGNYFAEDCRDVTEDGVNHVMRLFFKHVANVDIAAEAPVDTSNAILREARKVVKAICDEENLDAMSGSSGRR